MRALILFVFLLLLLPVCGSALVYIQPPTRSLSMFSIQQFTTNINIMSVNNVYGFQFNVLYNQTNLEFVSISEGTFLNNSGADRTFCLNPVTSTPGLIEGFACSRIGSGSVSGSGTLAVVTFRLKDVPTPSYGIINLTQVKISDINSQPLNNSAQNGTYTIYECLYGETRSCVVDGASGTRACGSNNIWGSCQASPPPPPGGGTPGGGSPGGYTPPQNTSQNTSITYSRGDVNSDGCVDIQDLVLIGTNFGIQSGFDARADANDDGKMDIYDLAIAGIEFGTGSKCP